MPLKVTRTASALYQVMTLCLMVQDLFDTTSDDTLEIVCCNILDYKQEKKKQKEPAQLFSRTKIGFLARNISTAQQSHTGQL